MHLEGMKGPRERTRSNIQFNVSSGPNCILQEVSRLSLTCSSGSCMVCEGNRRRPLLGNGEQVCIGPIR